MWRCVVFFCGGGLFTSENEDVNLTFYFLEKKKKMESVSMNENFSIISYGHLQKVLADTANAISANCNKSLLLYS
jgi:hypothetical protein